MLAILPCYSLAHTLSCDGLLAIGHHSHLMMEDTMWCNEDALDDGIAVEGIAETPFFISVSTLVGVCFVVRPVCHVVCEYVCLHVYSCLCT